VLHHLRGQQTSDRALPTAEDWLPIEVGAAEFARADAPEEQELVADPLMSVTAVQRLTGESRLCTAVWLGIWRELARASLG
jgi:hypothetical protein